MQIQSQSLWANRQLQQPPKLSQEQIKADAGAVFQKLDTQQKGYLEQADFSAALSQLQQSADDGQSAEWFSQLDADQDGKLTSDEFSTSVSEQLYNAQGKFGMPGGGPQGMPPMGPPPGEDEGKTVDELSAMVEELSSTDSKAAAGLQSIIDQFDSADANKDGKVTMQEAQALKQQSQSKTDSTTTTASTEDSSQLRLQQTLMQLMKTYGATASQSADNQSLSFSV
ncbi:EF-hand domain-containing protein [Rheinheimera texasensis]|uniref:EF-hand domain-containing protein n=1 Tax=Rheinheimera texasensis TaxID=306205 RepID=UPI0006923615|nr:EF-hand domain-containing protein [Rheinheimera texasensis]